MARPRSTDKQEAILHSAARVVAQAGVAAPTARIAKLAGIAEGTLFTYFPNKDALLNALYRHLKLDLRDAMMPGCPEGGSARDRLYHLWQGYVRWGAEHPEGFRAVMQLAVSERVGEEVRAECHQAYSLLRDVLEESVTSASLKAAPPLFASTLMGTMAETTIGLMTRDPANAAKYADAGFHAYWNAITGA
ncbi:TetR/AcrR family transcriptional regulator [Bordetella sp. 2513F-2]